MRNFIIAFFFLLFLYGVAANTYLRFSDEVYTSFSIVEEEEEHKGKIFEIKEYLVTENFFEDYITSQFLIVNDSFADLAKSYEEVAISCIETPPDTQI